MSYLVIQYDPDVKIELEDDETNCVGPFSTKEKANAYAAAAHDLTNGFINTGIEYLVIKLESPENMVNHWSVGLDTEDFIGPLFDRNAW